MKVKTYRQKGYVGIELVPEFCCEEETLIKELLNNKPKIVLSRNPFCRGLAIIIKENKISPFAAVESSKGNRFHLSPFIEQDEV